MFEKLPLKTPKLILAQRPFTLKCQGPYSTQHMPLSHLGARYQIPALSTNIQPQPPRPLRPHMVWFLEQLMREMVTYKADSAK